MSKVRTFSRFFPKGHTKEGQPTFFVEKFRKGLETIGYSEPLYHFDELIGLSSVISSEKYNSATPKLHTIRAGNHFKAGDYFSPRVWSGKPYASKQIIIAPDIEIKKVYEVNICKISGSFYVSIPMRLGYERMVSIGNLSNNDGLDIDDFKSWFNKLPFTGQIISWSENIDY